jgi:hypothetical protein
VTEELVHRARHPAAHVAWESGSAVTVSADLSPPASSPVGGPSRERSAPVGSPQPVCGLWGTRIAHEEALPGDSLRITFRGCSTAHRPKLLAARSDRRGEEHRGGCGDPSVGGLARETMNALHCRTRGQGVV